MGATAIARDTRSAEHGMELVGGWIGRFGQKVGAGSELASKWENEELESNSLNRSADVVGSRVHEATSRGALTLNPCEGGVKERTADMLLISPAQ